MSKIADQFYCDNAEDSTVEELVCTTGSTLNCQEEGSQEATTTTDTSSVDEDKITTLQLKDEIGIDISGTGQLSLFNFDDEPAQDHIAPSSQENKKGKKNKSSTEKSVVETSGKAPVKKDSKVVAKPKIDRIKIGAGTDWHIRYAGASYMVNLLFEEELLHGKTEITLEEIREKMITAEGCIELSPKRTHWDVDEANQLLALICKGEDKGGLV